ncbi:SDR family NAD(P)-dependent oxidoreductase [Hydrocarboniphaga sp.]|uniref:SDR family NAD(P)-dependent oxidoreductase n=1 Tax=Hydrocarboniphaga sp. TaxID=2033016 RepID=UPI00261FC842|nr:SDR family NAD(P)-dependent oxidoreductase [Hydrocarboniphaga sp.]
MTDTHMHIKQPPADYQADAADFKGRVILVTGATGGLGSAASQALARLGAHVILLGRSVPKLEKLYDAIEAAGGAQPAIVPINLMTATWAAYDDLAQTIEKEFGKLDGLLHAAAHFKSFTRLEDLEPRDWMDSLQVNLTAPYTLTRLCLPMLRESQDASVVFVTDDGGRVPKPFQAAYGVTKAAGETLFRSWAMELEAESRVGSGLRFNTWHPGPMGTEIRGKGYASDARAQVNPPERVIPQLLWLLGPASRGVTAQAL